MKKNILLGKGFNTVSFGMTKDELIKVLGEPTEIEAYEDEEVGYTESWHYDELELSANFEDFDGLKLISLAVSSPDFTFEGTDLIERSLEEVIQQIELLDLGEIEVEEFEVEELRGQIVATISEVSLNLWFEDGILTEIQWMPFWDDEDATFIWPDE